MKKFSRTNNAQFFNGVLLTTLAMLLSPRAASDDFGIMPPSYNLIDRHSVNVATNQVQIRLEDVKIGGSKGLQHIVSTYASDFVHYWGTPSVFGFNDNYRGGLYSTVFLKNNSEFAKDWTYSLNVSDGRESQQFSIHSNGTYVAIDDPRSTLAFVTESGFTGYLWIKSDGTEVRFPSNYKVQNMQEMISGGVRAYMQSIVYPDGFSIKVHKDSGGTIDSAIYSVNTNTGYQLKYHYADDNRPVPSAVTANNGYNMPPALSAIWASQLPSAISGVNNAYELCAPLTKYEAGCNFTYSWPVSRHWWPAGMPRALYALDGYFQVTDASGVVHKFNHSPSKDDVNTVYPRIKSVQVGGDTRQQYAYYFNQVPVSSGSLYTKFYRVGEPILSQSVMGSDIIGHDQFFRSAYNDNGTSSSGYNAYFNVQYNSYNMLSSISSWDKNITFNTLRNTSLIHQPVHNNTIKSVYYKVGGLTETFAYDSRYNITKKTVTGTDGVSTIVEEAGYSSTCTNRKTCNKPTWYRDGRGKQTDYEYHAESGLISKVSKPADVRGIRPVTRYDYAQYSASYYGADGSKIWLLTTESYCQNSAYVGDSCSASDKVTITYEYEPNNLQLVGKVVSSQKETSTQRTCYQYDRLGNQIGELPPKANVGKNTCVVAM